ncbi:hypothetical protein HU200_057387 [Digitaria exilis]|uniref:BHLH domain-containing protein n=1 Tax=Digitaria exilis TaxID=1010633 RepID=A0A835APR8_9POAL|nr:hypothetical protein HU200_057387 [Digitaria exilis]
MALLEAVAFRPDQPRVPCCVLRGYAIASAGDLEGTIIKKGVMVSQEGEGIVAAPPHGSTCCAWANVAAGGAATGLPSTLATSSARRPLHQTAVRRLRRRRRGTMATAARRTVVEAESQRQNHIAVDRNRRRQMNEYLAALRSLMPPSYARRVRAGAPLALAAGAGRISERFTRFFTFPQYSTAAADNVVDDASGSSSGGGETRSTTGAVADVEAVVSEGHATVKVLAPRRRRRRRRSQMLLGMQRRGLAALHLNATTTADHMMGDEWQLSSAGDVAATVHGIVAGGMDTAEGRAIYYPAN